MSVSITGVYELTNTDNITTWDRTTPNDGLRLGEEYGRLYANDNGIISDMNNLLCTSRKLTWFMG